MSTRGGNHAKTIWFGMSIVLFLAAAYLNYSVFIPHVTQSYTEVWETGTVILDVIDADNKKLVWRGTAETEVNPQAGPRENGPKLQKAIKMMLEKFPPK
jgi:hypothetical protein